MNTKNIYYIILGLVSVFYFNNGFAWHFKVYNHTPYDIYFWADTKGAAPKLKEGHFLIRAGEVGTFDKAWYDIVGTVYARTTSNALSVKKDNGASLNKLILNTSNMGGMGADISTTATLNMRVQRQDDGTFAFVSNDTPMNSRGIRAAFNPGSASSQVFHVYVKYLPAINGGWKEEFGIYKPAAFSDENQ